MITFSKKNYEIILDALDSYKRKRLKPVDNVTIEGICIRVRRCIEIGGDEEWKH